MYLLEKFDRIRRIELTAEREPLHPKRKNRIALHARLVLGEHHLHPDNKIPHLHHNHLEKYNPDFSETQALSDLERKKASLTMEQWVKGTVEAFTAKRDSFNSNSIEGNRWKDAFSRLGIDNVQAFNEENAKALYARFCSADRKGQEVKMFAEDILKTYGEQPDLAQVEKEIDAFVWLGKMFGKATAEILTEQVYLLALAKSKNVKKQRQFVFEANKDDRKNKPNSEEAELLHAVWSARHKGELVVPEFLGGVAEERPATPDIPILPHLPEILTTGAESEENNQDRLLFAPRLVRGIRSTANKVDRKFYSVGRRIKNIKTTHSTEKKVSA